MRGKGKLQMTTSLGMRITPAYAGKSSRGESDGGNIRDHPRLCGEKATRQQRKVKKIGSPPPMRGKVCTVRCGFLGMGITPAYAGKSISP